MAFSPEVAAILKQMGFKWTITDAPLFDAANEGRTVPYDTIGKVDGLPVFFRSGLSNVVSLEMPQRGDYDMAGFVSRMRTEVSSWFNGRRGHLTLAMDGETFGHHVPQYNIDALIMFAERCRQAGIRPKLFSEVLCSFPHEDVAIAPGSWSTTIADIKAGHYFPLWDHNQNLIHQEFKKLTQQDIIAVQQAEKVVTFYPDPDAKKYYEEARYKLDRGLHSCKEWWANRHHGKWHPDRIYSGMSLLERATNDACQAITLLSPREAADHLENNRLIVERLKTYIKPST